MRNPSIIFEFRDRILKEHKESIAFFNAHKSKISSSNMPIVSETFERTFKDVVAPLKSLSLVTDPSSWHWFDIGDLDSYQNVLSEDCINEAGLENLPFTHTVLSCVLHDKTEQQRKSISLYLFCYRRIDEETKEEEILIHSFTTLGDENFFDPKHKVVSLLKTDGKWSVGIRDRKYEGGKLHLYMIENSVSEALPHSELTFYAVVVKTVITFMKIVSCMNVAPKKEEFPKKLNKKRIAKGLLPSYDRHILIIHGKAGSANDALGGVHASPRLHFRRGHIRQYVDGKRVWVRECMVGKDSLGYVDKIYEVTPN